MNAESTVSPFCHKETKKSCLRNSGTHIAISWPFDALSLTVITSCDVSAGSIALFLFSQPFVFYLFGTSVKHSLNSNQLSALVATARFVGKNVFCQPPCLPQGFIVWGQDPFIFTVLSRVPKAIQEANSEGTLHLKDVEATTGTTRRRIGRNREDPPASAASPAARTRLPSASASEAPRRSASAMAYLARFTFFGQRQVRHNQNPGG